jgi:hypothetical protein
MSSQLTKQQSCGGAGKPGGMRFLRAAVLFIAFLLSVSGGAAPAGAEVIIQRTLPETGANRSEAEWKKPGTPERAAPGAEQEEIQRFSGRLILGGYGSGGGAAGVNVEDWSTDSQLTYGRLFGESGLLELDAAAFRKDSIDRFDQRYSGSFRYAGSNMRLALSGDFDEQEVQLADGRSEQYSGSVNADFTTAEESLLPLELHHSSSWEDTTGAGGAETEIEARREERHQMELAASAPLWAASLELDGYLDIHHDRLDELSTLGYGGTVGVAVPFTELLSLSGSVSPGYSATEEQLTDEKTEEIALEYDAGVVLTVEELLEGELHAALIDTWRTDPDVAGGDQVRDTLWKGRTSWSLTAPAELTSGFAYVVSGEGPSALSHDISADTAWHSDEGLLRTAKLNGQLLINEDTDFTDAIRRWVWNVSAGLAPAEGMALDSSYGGSSREEAGELSLQHNAAGSFSHAPAEAFDYGFGSTYAFTDDDSGIVQQVTAQGSLGLRPQIGFRRWDFSLSERFELENRSGGNDLFSRSDFSTAVPIVRPVSLRYGFGWEWVDFAASGSPEGSAFTHSAGVSASGAELPFSLRADYLLGHGYRGLQHQGDASLELTLARSLNIISELSYRFSETVEYDTPFRFSVLLHYEF